jgi:hypothetical protein
VTSHSKNPTLHTKMSYLVGCLKLTKMGIENQVTSHSENLTLHTWGSRCLETLEIPLPSYKLRGSFERYHLDICEDMRTTCRYLKMERLAVFYASWADIHDSTWGGVLEMETMYTIWSSLIYAYYYSDFILIWSYCNMSLFLSILVRKSLLFNLCNRMENIKE